MIKKHARYVAYSVIDIRKLFAYLLRLDSFTGANFDAEFDARDAAHARFRSAVGAAIVAGAVVVTIAPEVVAVAAAIVLLATTL